MILEMRLGEKYFPCQGAKDRQFVVKYIKQLANWINDINFVIGLVMRANIPIDIFNVYYNRRVTVSWKHSILNSVVFLFFFFGARQKNVIHFLN